MLLRQNKNYSNDVWCGQAIPKFAALLGDTIERAMERVFHCDEKFGDVIRVLQERGWRRATDEEPTLTWQNLSQTTFKKGRMVNHLHNAQTLSHKASFARLAHDYDWYPRCYDLRYERHALEFLRDIESSKRSFWLVKPAGGSCGTGIECVSTLADVVRIARAARWRVVVQKYVERPLLVRRKKFDVRQWILVSDTRPELVVFGFSRCYARFAGHDWSLENLNDNLAHLCNFSVQKSILSPYELDGVANDGFAEFSGSMWLSTQLSDYLDATARPGAWNDVILPQIKKIAADVARIGVRAGMKRIGRRAVEWLGLDVLIAEDLSAWLLEVNVSPDVSHSTPVTASLVPKATEEALNLLLEEEAPGQPTSANDSSSLLWELWLREDTTQSPVRPFVYKPDPHIDAWWDDVELRRQTGDEDEL